MGEKTTIEIEKMKELKQHALDTDKTLKQIINEAIEEKITRERKALNLPPIDFLDTAKPPKPFISSVDSKAKDDVNLIGDSTLDPEIIAIVQNKLASFGIKIETMTKDKWTDELESEIKNALDSLFDDENETLDTMRKVKLKFNVK
jgi:hypothetical protein